MKNIEPITDNFEKEIKRITRMNGEELSERKLNRLVDFFKSPKHAGLHTLIYLDKLDDMAYGFEDKSKLAKLYIDLSKHIHGDTNKNLNVNVDMALDETMENFEKKLMERKGFDIDS